MDEITSFGAWLRRARKACDLTQAELARRVGCAEGTVRNLEADALRPSKQLAARLAAQLGLPQEAHAAVIAFARGGAQAPVLPQLPALPSTGQSRALQAGLVRALDGAPHNLPAQPTPLVGRDRQVGVVRDLLRRSPARLVTLHGPGGVGKTRLGLQVAAELLDTFADGVFFVALAPIADPTLVPSAIAQTLGVKEGPGQPLVEQIKGYLRPRQLLLLLDNFEQVVGAAPHIAALLAAAPQLKVLVTSRAVLHLSGEQEFPVPPLALPDRRHLLRLEMLAQYEAIALFVQRAQAARPDFQLTAATAPAVVEICTRLDGLPLAIELAAARSKLFSPPALLGRLRSRLALLTDGTRDLPMRQQTLRNTIDWSYALLDAGVQALFARLAVFVGGFSLEAVEAVCVAADDPPLSALDRLSALVDQSLLQQMPGADGEPRFTFLETIREYALERLELSGEAEDVRQRHAQHFMGLAELAEQQLRAAEQSTWLDRLEVEHDNFRAALAWCQTQESELDAGLRLAAALWNFWEVRGHLNEGRHWLEALLARAPKRTALRSKALNAAGSLAFDQHDYAAATAFHEESLAIRRELGDARGIAVALGNLGNVARAQANYAAARARLEEGLAIFRDLGYTWAVGLALHNLGHVAREQRDYPAARHFYAESLRTVRELGDTQGIASSVHDLGYVALEEGDDGRALELFDESLALFHELGDKPGMAHAFHSLGLVAWHRGEYDVARVHLEASLRLRQELGDPQGTAACLAGLGGVAGVAARPEKAVRLFGATAALLEATGAHLEAIERAIYERSVAAARAVLGATRFAEAWAAGRAIPLEQAIAFALSEDVEGTALPHHVRSRADDTLPADARS